MPTPQSIFLAVDFETTGLTQGCVPVEWAISPLSCFENKWRRLGGLSSLLHPEDGRWEPEAVKLHSDNGLIAAIQEEAAKGMLPRAAVEHRMLSLVKQNFSLVPGSKQIVIVGDNPEFDRYILEAFFSEFASHCRMTIDLNAWRLVEATMRGIDPKMLKDSRRSKRHRALQDSAECAEEFCTIANSMDFIPY